MVIFFDLDETLFDHSSAEDEGVLRFLEHFSDDFQCGREEFIENWNRIADRQIERYWVGELSYIEQRRERMRELFRSYGTPLAEEDIDNIYGIFMRHYEENWRLFPDVLACLDALRGEHQLAVISNGNPQQQRRKLERLGILDRFSFVLTSEELGTCKPDPAIFQEASRRAGADPSNCIYVGDRLDIDAIASAAAGFTGVWVNRNGKEGGHPTVYTISGLSELGDVIENVQGKRRK